MIDIYEAFRLAFDTGILTLIWLVQMVIYPSLTRLSEVELKDWHPIYTKRVTFVVLPLMFGQLALSILHVVGSKNILDYMHLIIVIMAWGVTFIKAVPLHQDLDNQIDGIKVAHKLVEINKLRTILWSLAWGLSVYSATF